MLGYEWEKVGSCPKTGRMIVAPKVWNGKGGRPYHATCLCCGRKRDQK